MSSQRFIDAKELNNLLNEKKSKNLRILDCTYQVSSKADAEGYASKYLDNPEAFLKNDTPQYQTFAKSHIPTAQHFNLDFAMAPGEFERFTFMEPEKFQRYVQALGVNNGDQIVLYSRGPMGGMLFASRAFWIFKCYGHDNLSILNGGFEAWTKAGYETESFTDSSPATTPSTGNWNAEYSLYDHTISFYDLTTKDKQGKDVFEKSADVNIFDARPSPQFNNEADSGFDKAKVKGSHISGNKNLPCNEFVDENGLILSEDKIKEKLDSSGFDISKPTVTLCGLGIQASMLATIIDSIYPHAELKVYNGSLKEMELRAPERINGGIKK
uniref:Rhodanese domain-containing protein n=1 Tax=Panagrolaimus sp. ES5 TaxID=591445 RepID=A0AC34FJ29_9BILA